MTVCRCVHGWACFWFMPIWKETPSSPHKRCKHMGLSENMVPTRLIDDLDSCYTLVVSRIFGQTHLFPPDTTGKHCHPRTDQALSSSGCMPQCQALPLTSSKRVPSQVNTKVTNKSLLPKLWPVLFQHGWCQFYHLGLVNSIWGLQDSHVSVFLSQARLADPVPKPSPKRQLQPLRSRYGLCTTARLKIESQLGSALVWRLCQTKVETRRWMGSNPHSKSIFIPVLLWTALHSISIFSSEKGKALKLLKWLKYQHTVDWSLALNALTFATEPKTWQ